MSNSGIGLTSRNGLFQVMDINWDHNGSFRVAVRDTVGNDCLDMSRERRIRAMRDLARRAVPMPWLTRHTRLAQERCACGCGQSIFVVSRLERD